MSKRKKRLPQKQRASEKRSADSYTLNTVGYVLSNDFDSVCATTGYTSLDKCPEVMTGVRRIAELVGSMTIYLMENTKNGDVRISNALSRKIDIDPMPNMVRSKWMEAIVTNLYLYGKGNSIVVPHTKDGYLEALEPISADRVSFLPEGNSRMYYKVMIDSRARDPENVLHFILNPDKYYLWKGSGVHVSLRDIANNLKQARATEAGFMESEYKPSIIVKVDAMVDEFSTPDGRQKILDSYVKSVNIGEPWLIPAESFQVEQVKPLSLEDLAINDTVEIDKRTVASILGIPPFVLGVGAYSQQEWNNFIQNTIRPLALGIQQEMTKKLIVSDKWYLRFNTLSLMDWNIETASNVFGSLYDRGIVTGNEVRDRIGLDPKEDLDRLLVLENYIPVDKASDQLKLKQGEEK